MAFMREPNCVCMNIPAHTSCPQAWGKALHSAPAIATSHPHGIYSCPW